MKRYLLEDNNLRVVALPQVVGEVVLDVLGELLQEVGVEAQHLCQTRDVEHLEMQQTQHLDRHESICLDAFTNRLQIMCHYEHFSLPSWG